MAVALFAGGLAVIGVLRGNLMDRAGLESEIAARTTAASQAALNGRFGSLDLPADNGRLVQVVGSSGTVLASGGALDGDRLVADFDPAPAPAASPSLSPSPSPTAVDNDDDSAGRGGRGRGRGGGSGRGGGRDTGDRAVTGTAGTTANGDRGDDREGTPTAAPPRGEVGTGAAYRTLSVDVGNGPHDYRFAAVRATTQDGRTFTVYAGTSLSADQEVVDEVTEAMLIGMPPMLAVVAAVTWLMTRRALRPVEGIRAEMAEITASRDLSRRVPLPSSHDEVARLAGTTNETLAALERSVERQHRFVADASHELRSPIASLRTQLEVAAAHPSTLDLDGLLTDTVRIQRVAADLLLLARLDAGEGAGKKVVDLAALVREELAQRHTDRIAPAVHLDGDVEVPGNRAQLDRVLGNLLDNAQRHARSAVTVTVRQDGSRGVLSVADDGPGVPRHERERVFERFVRLDDARSRDDGGAGLGLAIAREVAVRHGGSLTVRDAAGGGAVFEVDLPRVPPPAN